MKLGIHASVRGGFEKALEEAQGLGCETLQIFTHAPRLWRAERISPEEADIFHRRRQSLPLAPLVIHTPYLPNLCTADEKMYARSYRALLSDLEIGVRVRADFYVIHPGSFSPTENRRHGRMRIADALNRALQYGPGPMILLENMAGGGRRIGATFEELAEILEKIELGERVGICLDTAHTIASGYAFSTPDEVQQTLAELHRTIGLSRVRVVHLNDSKGLRGSHLDLHEHIGAGHIGLDSFRALLTHPGLQHVAGIIETPRQSAADDRKNLATLRKLRSEPHAA